MSDKLSIDERLDEIFSLFTKYGDSDYLGEPLSKTAHSIQAGMQAEAEGFNDSIVLGAFLHDIGHLIGEHNSMDNMHFQGTNLGTQDHGNVGADYLQSHGFGADVTDIVRAHVQAKRYLCAVDKDYYEKLSWASKQTLEWQGGVMNEAHVAQFQSHPDYRTFVRMRHWDEQAKEADKKDMQSLDHYKCMAAKYLAEKEKLR